VYTYAEPFSSAYDGPSLEWVILGSRWEQTTSAMTLRTAEWMLDVQNFWAWRADDDHLDCHLHTASGTCASAPSQTFQVGDHSASKTKATQHRLTFHANKSVYLCAFTPMLHQILQLTYQPLASGCLLQAC